MKNILYLTKVLFINSLGASSSKKKSKKKSSPKGIIALFLFLIAIVFVPMIYFGIEIGGIFAPFDILDILIKFIIPIATIMVFVFSIFSIISTFFLSNDIETLLALPLKPYEIIVAKFLTSLSSVYLIELMLLTPLIAGIGIAFNVGVMFYILLILITIFLPFFPIAIVGIILTSLMRYTAMSKMKDKMQYFIMVFAIIFSIGIQFLSQGAADAMIEIETTGDLLEATLGGIATKMSSIMFFTYPASISLYTENILLSILWMLLFIAISILGVGLFAFVGQKIYIKGILGKPQLKSKKEKQEKVELKQEKNTSIFKNLVANEWKTVWRSPSFNMNLIAVVVIVPIIFVISFGFSFARSGEVGLSFKDMIEAIKTIITFDSAYSMAFTIAVFSFMTSFSGFSATAISRDGKHAWFNKIVPIKPMTIIYSKIFWGVVLSFVPVFILSLACLVLSIFTFFEFILVVVPIFFLVVVSNLLGLMIDLWKPKLSWDNEQAAVKQNTNYLLFMLVDFGFTAIIALIGVLFIKIDLANYVTSLIITLLFSTTCAILIRLLNKKGMDVFKNIG